jgi:hypothetical protein
MDHSTAADDHAARRCELMTLPTELLNQISTTLSIVDTASLSVTSEWMRQVSNRGGFHHSMVMWRMQAALECFAGPDTVCAALDSIAGLPLVERPSALRMFSSRRVPMLSLDRTVLFRSWYDVIENTRNALICTSALARRTGLEADLAIASWHAFFPCSVYNILPYSRQFYVVMEALPWKHWPSMLDAVATRTNILGWEGLSRTSRNLSITYPGVTNNVAAAILNATGGGRTDKAFARIQRCFNITEAQRHTLSFPGLARDMVNRVEGHRHFTAMWRTLNVTNAALIDAAEHIYLEGSFERFLSRHRDWMEMGAPGRQPTVKEQARWDIKARAFFGRVERDACASVALSRGPDAEGTPGCEQDELIGEVEQFSEAFFRYEDVETMFDRALQAPRGFQPVLLDHWATLIEKRVDMVRSVALMARVTTWCDTVVEDFTVQNEPVNAVRAYVALLRTCVNSMDASTIAAVVDKVVYGVFETLPIAASAAMLSFFCEAKAREKPLVDDKQLARWMTAFAQDPHSNVAFLPKAFAKSLIEVVAVDFLSFPDKRQGDATKFNRFCTRFSIPQSLQAGARKAMINGMMQGIRLDQPRLRVLLRTRLSLAGFNDSASFDTALAVVRNHRNAVLTGARV